MTDIVLPLDHLSYSSVRLFCSNQQQFFKNYILGIFDYKNSPTATVGKACHKALEHYYKTGNFEKGVEVGLAYLNTLKDADIDYGKTGTREQMLKNYTKGVNNYRKEEPNLGNVLGVEVMVTTDKGLEDEILPIPLKAITDVVSEKDNLLKMWDYKFVGFHTDKDDEQPDYILQAMWNFITIRAKFGRDPYSMTFLEVKLSENKSGEPQIQPYEIVFDKHPEYKKYMYKIYTEVLTEIANPEKKYLPNFGDYMNGKEAWKDFVADVIDFKAIPQVSHKTTLTKMRSVEYVNSEIEANTNLSDEEKIRIKLQEFGVAVEMKETFVGQNVTLYTMKPSRGVKMSQFKAYEPDLSLALESKSVRIQAPIPESGLVGVEVSNKKQGTIDWSKSLVEKEKLEIPVGVNVYGKAQKISLNKAPHLLIGGTTGSGKSVFMNVVIKTLTEAMTPEHLQVLLIDPKQTEFMDYENLPHLIDRVITETEDAEASLRWLVEEMQSRYTTLKTARVKTIDDYNSSVNKTMPYIVVVIDELADLMLNRVKNEDGELLSVSIENSIVRLAQKARAVGIHLVVATQRPSVDVITGLIKANIPTRVSFMVSTKIDSQVILDEVGAEKLIGSGDLLYMNPREQGLQRLQGYYIK